MLLLLVRSPIVAVQACHGMPPSGISAENDHVGDRDVWLQDQEKKDDAESGANVDGISCVLSYQDFA